jgi:hypothetical protein
MSSAKEPASAAAADVAALRAKQEKFSIQADGNGHPGQREGGPAEKAALPGPPRAAEQAAHERALKYQALAEGLARGQFQRCDRVVPLDELLGEARLALVNAARGV